jgi:hypothetical protein
LCLLFAITRQRGTVPAGDFETQSGQAVRVHSDGHLSLPSARPEITELEPTVHIRASTYTTREAEKLLRGMKRRYATFDFGPFCTILVQAGRRGQINCSQWPWTRAKVAGKDSGKSQGRTDLTQTEARPDTQPHKSSKRLNSTAEFSRRVL